MSSPKYKVGTSVYALQNPETELIVRRFIKDIYYCQLKKDPHRKDLVYWEHELASGNDPSSRVHHAGGKNENL